MGSVGREMGVLDGSGDRQRGRGSFGVNLRHPLVTNGDGDVLFPNYIGRTCFRLG